LRLANEKIADAARRITMPCAFDCEVDSLVAIRYRFYVLMKVVAPLIMGWKFLEETETLTTSRERLVQVPRPALQALSICSVDRQRQVLSCNLNHKPLRAIVDTGPEIDLITLQAAFELGLLVHSCRELLKLADGSTIITSGYVRATLSLDNVLTGADETYNGASTIVEFYLYMVSHMRWLWEQKLLRN
jgi:hypothetical protein